MSYDYRHCCAVRERVRIISHRLGRATLGNEDAMNSHLGRGFTVASGVSNFLPEGVLCVRSRQVLHLQAKYFPASDLLKAGNDFYPIAQWNSNSGQCQNHLENLVKMQRPRFPVLQ